jgi:hypothetical protein
MCACGVATGDNEVRANVSLVTEQVLLQERHASDDARLSTSRERVQLEL